MAKPTNFPDGLGVGTITDLLNAVVFSGEGSPTNAVTGATFAGPGSIYIDTTGANAYINANTKASPTWKLITRAA